jgi:hypothetical protein
MRIYSNSKVRKKISRKDAKSQRNELQHINSANFAPLRLCEHLFFLCAPTLSLPKGVANGFSKLELFQKLYSFFYWRMSSK